MSFLHFSAGDPVCRYFYPTWKNLCPRPKPSGSGKLGPTFMPQGELKRVVLRQASDRCIKLTARWVAARWGDSMLAEVFRSHRLTATAQAATVGDVASPSRVQEATAAVAGSNNEPTPDFEARLVFDDGAHSATSYREGSGWP